MENNYFTSLRLKTPGICVTAPIREEADLESCQINIKLGYGLGKRRARLYLLH